MRSDLPRPSARAAARADGDHTDNGRRAPGEAEGGRGEGPPPTPTASASSCGGDGHSHSKRRRPEREGKEGEPSTSSRVVDEAALRAQVDARVADMVAGHPEVGDDLAFIVTNLQKGQGKIDPSSVPDEDLRSKLEALFAILVKHKIVSCDVKGRYSRGAESSHLSMIIAALEATRRSEPPPGEKPGRGNRPDPRRSPQNRRRRRRGGSRDLSARPCPPGSPDPLGPPSALRCLPGQRVPTLPSARP